jgi:FKBP-type peptidyl-prolyl cis-trans isomerase
MMSSRVLPAQAACGDAAMRRGLLRAAPRRQLCARATHEAAAADASSSSSPSPSSGRRAVLLAAAAAALAARPARADDEEAAAQPPAPLEEPAAALQPQAVAAEQDGQPSSQRVSAAAESDDGTGDVSLLTTEAAAAVLTPTDRQVLALNRRVQAQNRAPKEFPAFVRQGFDIKIIADGFSADESGLVYRDYDRGDASKGTPVDGQEVVFDYVGYNESGAVIDSSYRLGRPAQTRLGVKGLIPGFELGLRGMRPGGKRRVVVPPALGPPVGPQTFFSAKQCEVFDVEMHEIRNCERKTVGMFSNVVCQPVA